MKLKSISHLVDIAALDELYELLDRDLDGIVYLFKTNSSEQLDALELALTKGALEQMVHEAHSLKGSCRNIGAFYLAAQVENLENLAKAYEEFEAIPKAKQEELSQGVSALRPLHFETQSALQFYIQSK